MASRRAQLHSRARLHLTVDPSPPPYRPRANRPPTHSTPPTPRSALTGVWDGYLAGSGEPSRQVKLNSTITSPFGLYGTLSLVSPPGAEDPSPPHSNWAWSFSEGGSESGVLLLLPTDDGAPSSPSSPLRVVCAFEFTRLGNLGGNSLSLHSGDDGATHACGVSLTVASKGGARTPPSLHLDVTVVDARSGALVLTVALVKRDDPSKPFSYSRLGQFGTVGVLLVVQVLIKGVFRGTIKIPGFPGLGGMGRQQDVAAMAERRLALAAQRRAAARAVVATPGELAAPPPPPTSVEGKEE